MVSNNNYSSEDLAKKYSQKVFNIAYRIIGHFDEAEDIVQETFLKVHNNLSGFRGDCHIYTWIYRIAVNISLNYKSRLARVTQLSLDESNEIPYQPLNENTFAGLNEVESEILKKELTYEIKEKCHHFMTYRLSTELRIVFILRVMVKLKYKDIAYILDITENVAKTRASRARKKLKEYLHKKCSWVNPENSCRCDTQLGYIISKYPQMLKMVKSRATDEDYRNMVVSILNMSNQSFDDIYKRVPEIEYHIN